MKRKKQWLLCVICFLIAGLLCACTAPESAPTQENLTRLANADRDLLAKTVSALQEMDLPYIHVVCDPEDGLLLRYLPDGVTVPCADEDIEAAFSLPALDSICFSASELGRASAFFAFYPADSGAAVLRGLYWSADNSPIGLNGTEVTFVHKKHQWFWMDEESSAWYYSARLYENWFYYEWHRS